MKRRMMMSKDDIDIRYSVCNGRAVGSGMGNIKSYCIGAKCIKYAKFFMS